MLQQCGRRGGGCIDDVAVVVVVVVVVVAGAGCNPIDAIAIAVVMQWMDVATTMDAAERASLLWLLEVVDAMVWMLLLPRLCCNDDGCQGCYDHHHGCSTGCGANAGKRITSV